MIHFLPTYEDENGETHKVDTIVLKMKDLIIPMYDDVLLDIFRHNHVHYVFPGGRGSTKSSFMAIAILLLMIANPDVNAVCFRKIGNTIQNSIYSQIVWAIYELGLEGLFHIPKVHTSPIIFLPTGQRIFFMGLDDPDKVKSLKAIKGYIGITWFNNSDQVKPLEFMETPNI